MVLNFNGMDSTFFKSLLGTSPAIERCYSIAMIRELARKRLPRMVFDFIDGAADDEHTLDRNQSDLNAIMFRPQLLEEAPVVSKATTLLGEELAMPLLLGPTGLAGLHHPDGEIAAAKAAESRGTAFTVSTMSSRSYRSVAAEVERKPWFQLYQSSDENLNDALLSQAWNHGCRVLVVTIDIPVSGNRERDLRNGFTIPPVITPRNIRGVARRPWTTAKWFKQFLQGPGISLGSVTDAYDSLGKPGAAFAQVAKQTWADIEKFRHKWKGKLVVKGVMSDRDARLSVKHGADGVIVSNHGGRQLDGLPSSISVLPEVVQELHGTNAAVLFDGGIRRGADVLRAMALGADAGLIGRPWAWGLAAAGQEGIEKVIDILEADIERVQHHLGLPHIHDIDSTYLRPLPIQSVITDAKFESLAATPADRHSVDSAMRAEGTQ